MESAYGNLGPALGWDLRGVASTIRALLVVLCCSGASLASTSEHAPEVGGYVQMWWTAYEQLENGRVQSKTQDEAQQEAHGYSFRRVRVSVRSGPGPERLGYRVELKLESTPELSDCYLFIRLSETLKLYFGQMKIPSTYEVGVSSVDLDFISRSVISRRMPDWALSGYPSDFGTVTFTASPSVLRDLGVGLKGAVGGGLLHYFAMMGNGLGANLYIGGNENRQFIRTNGFGALLYGMRVDLRPVDRVVLGGHYTLNTHENMIIRDIAKGAVIDLHRKTWSVDAGIACPGRVRLRGLWAGGAMDEDLLYQDGKKDYLYRGYEGKGVWEVLPDRLEAGARFDRYRCEFNESGDRREENTWTFGGTYRHSAVLKGQVNYLHKETRARDEPDLEDDLLFANLQFVF